MRTPPATYGPWRQAAWHAGFLAGHASTLEGTQGALESSRLDSERTLAVLREENSTLRRMLEATAARADTLTTELARSLVMTAPAPRPGGLTPPPPAVRVPTSPDPIRGLGNILDPVPFTDPDGEFRSVEAASLMAVEEDDGHHAAA